MSPKNPFLTVGLTALGLFGFAASRVAYSGDPPVPPGPPAAPASSPTTHSVLLLSNGRVLQGAIAEAGKDYELRQRGGVIRFPKSDVEQVFRSLAEVYDYKRSQVPDRDPDEHLKLARWCLTQKMQGEAKAELAIVLKLSPGAGEARAMLASIEAAEVRAEARPRVDPALVQTKAEVVAPADRAATADARPAEIDARVLRDARRELGVKGLPIIFDLPPAIAVRRADQFSRVVHPVLQASCAKCHNEHYEGKFQLIEMRSRRDLTANAFRANLDATLQLIDADNPAKSEILSSALVPHGVGPNKRPIFRGPNDPRFQILYAWVTSLRTGKAPDGVAQAQFEPNGNAQGGGFAVDRAPAPGQPLSPAPSTLRPGPAVAPNAAINSPGMRFVPGGTPNPRLLGPSNGVKSALEIGNSAGRFVPEGDAPGDDEFPVPFAAGGPKPNLNPTLPGVPPSARPTVPMPGAGTTTPPTGPVPPLPDAATTADTEAAKKADPSKPKKKVQIDPNLLQRALMNRNLMR